ncbi:DUF1648 domain-containing protein [Weeksella virosa]|uniref:DUF1648 domain-containing protein n=1 Tax=Weeksella virosa (strain ATCC 43766 / DSM 16922 / JCM 21250 / CCUG 30538 / CDC 9751 / IAM 14551 / NBRC 16016 / NCTC 11634 / CL345/78) TaxID=865938 RepID=F0P1S6_WEEVC|nr:DUF1648 domain-containing protein [Weeksella virosa]ADX68723.1 protein of unknown function DUF1648 [Weeksella virosa DSM 16922]VEH63606.1 Predicted integral membrane protein [Weeksella virosa]
MEQLQKTYYDFLIEIITYIVIIVSVVFLFINYQQLPTTIPIHFNARGEVDGVGEKYTLYILVLIQIILFIGLNFLSKKPHLYNYPVPLPTIIKHNNINWQVVLFGCLTCLLVLFFSC